MPKKTPFAKMPLKKPVCVLACLAFLACATVPPIVVPPTAPPQVNTAVGELADYVARITGERPKVIPETATPLAEQAFYLGDTRLARKCGLGADVLEHDEWALQSHGDSLVVTGAAPRGCLYAVYHYLEAFLHVRFWNHQEESVPVGKTLPMQGIHLRGRPAFDHRELCSLHVKDSGRLAAKLMLNSTRGNYYGQMNPLEKRNFGMESIFGPPDFAHTFHLYIPYRKYYSSNPEFFALVDGQRMGADCTPANNAKAGSLCLSNQELRRELLANLKLFIAKGRDEARRRGAAFPSLYDISSNDNQVVCECPNCHAIIEKYKAVSGLYLETINELADAIREEYPEVTLHTYAYLKTSEPPTGIKTRPNVCITLCDHDGNLYDDYTADDHPFIQRLRAWREVCGQMRVWVYGLTFATPRGLPYPNEFKYAAALRTFRDNGVQMMMQQLESPILSDSWDYKLWVWAKLAENPDQDALKVMEDFANGYYGEAGRYFVAYRRALFESAERRRLCLPIYAMPAAFVHLDYAFLKKADELFAQGESALAGKPILLRRWRAARLPVDRAVLARSRILQSEYFMGHGESLAGYHFDHPAIAERVEKTVQEQLKYRQDMVLLAGDERRFQAEKELWNWNVPERALRPPKRFAHLKPGEYFDFPASAAFRPGNKAVLREDPEAESGHAVFWNVKQTETQPHQDNVTFRWGMYSPSLRSSWQAGEMAWEDIGWDGYRWLNLGDYRLTSDCLLYLFATWQVQMVVGSAVDPMSPERRSTVWTRVKLLGKDERNAPVEVGLDRIVLVPCPR